MLQCAVCGQDVSRSIDTPVGKTVAGTPELDPSRGTKRYWEGVWRYFDSLECRSHFDSASSNYTDACLSDVKSAQIGSNPPLNSHA